MIILRKIALPTAQEIYRNGTIVADTISGTLDGSNKTFYTTYNYRRDRIDLHYNGQALHAPYDFLQTGDNEITLLLDEGPFLDDNLRATYEIDTSVYDPSYRGATPVLLNSVSQNIVFPSPLSDLSYNINIELVTSDGNPSVYSVVVGNKTTSGFTVFFSGEIDTGNYILEWEVFR
jgi:hypothetical protein